MVYGNETRDISKVQAWACTTNAGPINLFNKPHLGCPKMQQSVEVEQIDEKFPQNRAITQWQLAKETGNYYWEGEWFLQNIVPEEEL